TLQKILVPEGKTVPIGEPIALIGDGPVDDSVPSAEPAAPAAAAPAAPAATAPAAAPAAPAPAPAAPAPAAAAPAPAATNNTSGERIKASPLARRLAAERGIDLSQVVGTGPGGRIIKENIEDF